MELAKELKTIKWDFIGFIKMRREAEAAIALKTGYWFRFRRAQDPSNGGVHYKFIGGGFITNS